MQVKAVDLDEYGSGRSGRGTAVSDPKRLFTKLLQKYENANEEKRIILEPSQMLNWNVR